MVEGLRTLGLIVLSALLGLGVAMPVAAQQCDIDIILLNKDRLITGEVDAECPSVLPPDAFHSAPFGNWGVESNLSDHRVDGFQFSGWKIEGSDPWLQWNSCTTHDDFEPGNPSYYNDANFTAQLAHPNVVNVVHAHGRYESSRQACEQLVPNGFYAVGSSVMRLYELDKPFGRSMTTHVATLSYGSIPVSVSCPDPWFCYGESGWFSPQSGDEHVTAKIQLIVRMHRR